MYTDLELLRKMISDPFRRSYDSQEGDDSTFIYKLTHGNIKDDSYTVYVGGIESSDYDLDQAEGVLTFNEPPAVGQDVEVKYQYSAFSDTELTNFLAIDETVQKSALRCLDILLWDSARRFDYVSGQTEFKPSQVFDHLSKLRMVLEKNVSSEKVEAGGASIVKRSSRYYEDTAVASHDLSRDDLGD